MVDFKVVRSCSMEESLSFSSLTHHDGFFFRMSGKCLVWENSQHFAMLSLVFPPSDVWETSAEIPYWWCEHQYPDLGSVSDWLSRMGNLIQPIRNTIQIWVMARHQYRISVLVSQTSFGGETIRSVAKKFRYHEVLPIINWFCLNSHTVGYFCPEA